VLNIPVALVFVCRKNFESIILSNGIVYLYRVQVLLVQCSDNNNWNTTTMKNDTASSVTSNVRDGIIPFSSVTNQPNYHTIVH